MFRFLYLGLCALLVPARAWAENVSLVVAKPGHLVLINGAFDPKQSDLRSVEAEEAEPGPFVVQFTGSVDSRLHARIEGIGGQVLGYLPVNALIIRGAHGVAEMLECESDVRWVGRLDARHKVSERLGAVLREREDRWLNVMVRGYFGADLHDLARRMEDAGGQINSVSLRPEVLRTRTRFGDTFDVTVPRSVVTDVAEMGEVQWIDLREQRSLRNSDTRWVMQGNVAGEYPVWRAGLYGRDTVIGHIDEGIDEAICAFDDGVPIGPNHRKIVAYRGVSPRLNLGHGDHTAATAAGDARNTGGGFGDLTGQAFGARLSHQVLPLNDNLELGRALLYAWQDGARSHTNSWGNDNTRSYTLDCQDIDNFSYSAENSVVCFAVTNTALLKTPENAKNVVAVGATDRPPNQHRWCSGGRGPTLDGRRKPEVSLPGCDILSARRMLFGSGGCRSGSMSGTSMAAPAVTAAVAMIEEYFVRGFHPSGEATPGDGFEPSGALVRAVLVNGAQDITGVSGYPSDQEGWGRVDLEESLEFSGDARALWVEERRHVAGLGRGEFQDFEVEVGPGEPLRITLAFNDYPASVNASYAPVNDMDLFVRSPGGAIYSGNHFAANQSVPGVARDPLNTIEQVHVLAPEAGTWGVRVWAREVRMGDAQGWGLAISGVLR